MNNNIISHIFYQKIFTRESQILLIKVFKIISVKNSSPSDKQISLHSSFSLGKKTKQNKNRLSMLCYKARISNFVFYNCYRCLFSIYYIILIFMFWAHHCFKFLYNQVYTFFNILHYFHVQKFLTILKQLNIYRV